MPLPAAGILNATGASVTMGVLLALYLSEKPECKRELAGAIALYSVLVIGLMVWWTT